MLNDTFRDAFLYTYKTGLGEFDTDVYDETDYKTFFWLAFFGVTIIIQIVLLNLLIAIQGDIFDRVMESMDQSIYREICNVIMEYSLFVSYKNDLFRSLFIMKISLIKADVKNYTWEGKLSALKSSF